MLNCYGILGSSPDMDRRFRFEPWTGSWRQIPSAVNDLTREHSRWFEGHKGIQKCGPGKNIQLSSVLEFYSSGFLGWNLRLLSLGGHNSFSRGAVSDPQMVHLT